MLPWSPLQLDSRWAWREGRADPRCIFHLEPGKPEPINSSAPAAPAGAPGWRGQAVGCLLLARHRKCTRSTWPATLGQSCSSPGPAKEGEGICWLTQRPGIKQSPEPKANQVKRAPAHSEHSFCLLLVWAAAMALTLLSRLPEKWGMVGGLAAWVTGVRRNLPLLESC